MRYWMTMLGMFTVPFLCGVLVTYLFLAWRNIIVGQVRARALSSICKALDVKKVLLREREYDYIFGKLLKIMTEYGSYNEMLFGQLWKWSFKAFYPDLSDRIWEVIKEDWSTESNEEDDNETIKV